MNRLHSLKILAGLAAATLLTACTNDDDLTQDEPLPPGMYPLELNASIAVATPTRATADGTWEGTETVVVQVEDGGGGSEGTYLYTATSDGMLTPVSPYYWKSTSQPIRVIAWHFGDNHSPSTGTWIVKGNQSNDYGFQNSDFIYAPPVEMSFSGQNNGTNPALEFHHQVAKVTVHVRKAEVAENAVLNGMTIENTITGGGWTAPESGNYGSWGTLPRDPGSITPLPLGAQEFTNNGKTETSAASYTAIVIPQTIDAGKTLFAFDVEGYDPFGYSVPSGGIKWEAGMHYTYIITVKSNTVEVYFKINSWNNGSETSDTDYVNETK